MEKLKKVKFGIAGGLTTSIFLLFIELLLWIKLVPLYNSLMVNIYGVVAYSTGFLLFASVLFIILGFIFGFSLFYLFAWIYNKLLEIK